MSALGHFSGISGQADDVRSWRQSGPHRFAHEIEFAPAPPQEQAAERALWRKCAARPLDRAGIARPQRVPIKTHAHRGVVVARADFSTSIHRFVIVSDFASRGIGARAMPCRAFMAIPAAAVMLAT